MNRQEVTKKILSYDNKTVIAELPTSYGKTAIALKWCMKYKPKSVLVVIPRLVLIDNWKDEIIKWKYGKHIDKFTFSTYVSLGKHVDKQYDVIIFDEAHHISERCESYIEQMTLNRCILLSATMGRKIDNMFNIFKDVKLFKISARKAIEDNVLPDPVVYLIPLKLDNTKYTETIVKNPKKSNEIHIYIKDRWGFKNNKTDKIVIHCTQQQKYNDMCSEIEFYKRKNYIGYMKNIWLHKCGERLKWLSDIKTDIIKDLLLKYENYRTLTFCNSIRQTELLGDYPINSKNDSSNDNLTLFNKGKVNHITAVDMLNEGINLVNCQVGIFAVLNSSDCMKFQKLGRILRHKEPIIIIPYFENTREEEIMKDMLEMYNKNLVKTINLY